MAFFRQLRLLLWKNGLASIRQPIWSLTLLVWPLTIFIIIAVTRHQFPPIVKDTCYVSPRNLPSAGFFPFLQTLMCNADSKCSDVSSLVDPTESKSSQNKRSNTQKNSLLADLIKGRDFFNFPSSSNSSVDPEKVTRFLRNFQSSSVQERLNNVSLGNANTTLLEHQETLNDVFESVNLVKRAVCTLTLPIANATSPNHFTYAVVTFCNSNNTVFETSLLTLNQILTELILTKPDEVMTAAGTAVMMFDQLQNQTSLWESLLAIPQLFSSNADQVLNSTDALLANLQGVMNVIQSNFPAADASLSSIHPLLVGSVNTIQYVQNWPGKDVSIPLGEIVTLQNDSLSEMMKRVLQEVQIPLDKAIGLTLDKNIVHSYLCDNSSNSILLSVACSTGTVDMILGWISPNKVAKQALLAWSKNVASHDLSFIKEIVQSLTGASSQVDQGGSNNARRRRSVAVQPQSTEEELFLAVGEVVMEIVGIVPEVDMIVQSILRIGFQSMKSTSLALDTTIEIMTNALKDADQFQQTYLTLLKNQTEASIWIDRVLESVVELALKVVASESLPCEDILGPFEWLLSSESITNDVWKSVICQNDSSLQVLPKDWQSLIQTTKDLYSSLTGQADYNTTLPMILTEWQRLINSSLQFQVLLDKLTTELDGEYWMNWMTDSSTLDVAGTLEQRVFLFAETLGGEIETSQLWPVVKNYFNIVYWILNYTPGVTTQPANCSINNSTLAIHCDTGLNWPQFVQAMTQALRSPNETLVNCLEGTVNLLQHMYGDISKNLTASYMKRHIRDGDALAAYLSNSTSNLDGFFHNGSGVPNFNISNLNSVLPLLSSLLQQTGLTQLLPLFLSDVPINVSTVLDIALNIGKIHQPISDSNKTDPTMLELEQLIMQILSLEGNLTMPLSHIMAYNLLNYIEHFNSDDMANLTEAIRSITNQTLAGNVEAILSAIEQLKTIMDSPNEDPANLIFQYIHQLQELVMSLLSLQKSKHAMLPSGNLSTTQVNHLVQDIINFLKPETLQNLTQSGPDAVQNFFFQKFVEFLPPSVQQEAAGFLQNFKAMEHQMAQCAESKNCSTGISEVFASINQIVDMISANSNGTITIVANNSVLEESEYEEIASMFFSLLLCPSNASKVQLFNQTVYFMKLIMATPNISMSDIERALEQSNLTLEELHDIAALVGGVTVTDQLDKVIDIMHTLQCLDPQQDPMAIAQCVVDLVDGISNVVMRMPYLYNETSIISFISLVIDGTKGNITHVNHSSNPNIVVINTLESTLANIKKNLKLNQLYTPEIMSEIKMVEGLLKLFGNMDAFNENLNTSLTMDSMYAERMYLEIVDWYLKRLENVTSNSSVSELLHPFFYLTQMQVSLQLAQTDFSSFVSSQVEFLINNLQYPVDGEGLRKIGGTVTEIVQHLFDLINLNFNVQNTMSGSDLLFNTTILNATEAQMKQYLDLIQQWMIQPNVSLALTNLLQWGNSSMNASTPFRDIQQLLEDLNTFFSDDQLAYLSVIENITQSLTHALALAQQPHGLQSDDFIAATMEAVQSAMQILPDVTHLLPVSTQHDILELIKDSLEVLVQPGMSFASSYNISFILKTAESVIEHTDIPDMVKQYLGYGIEVANTFSESIFSSGEPAGWSQMVLNEIKSVQSFLPPNSTAESYVSLLINITHFMLESGQGFENASVQNMSIIFDKIDKALNILWQFAMKGPNSLTTAPSLESFAQLAPVLEEMMTGKADQGTWDSLETILETLFSTLEGTELWDNVSSVIPQFQNIVGSMVSVAEAENELILSLQMPLLTLMREIAQSVNTSRFNLSDVSAGIQLAIQSMANGSLECRDVLQEWDLVRQATALTNASMSMWCNISLEPVLEAVAASQTVYSHLNISHMGVGQVTVKAAAVRIVNTLQSLYQVSVNQTLVTEMLIRAFANQVSMLASQPLCPEAQVYWKTQLLDMELHNSLSSITQLTEELVKEAPFLQPYIKAIGNALHYILNNYQLLQGNSSAQDLFKEVEIISTSVNITLDNIFSMLWGNLSGLNETSFTDMMREAVKLLSDRQIFGHEPMIYQVLEQFLANNSTCFILQKLVKTNAWLDATQRNITLDTIYSMLSGNLSGVNNTSITEMIREAVKLLSDLHGFKEEPMVYQALEQLLTCNDTKCIVQKVANITTWLTSSQVNITAENIYSILSGNFSEINDTSITNMIREAVKLLGEHQMFGNESVIYEVLVQFLTCNDTSLIVEKMNQMTALYFSNQTTSLSNIFYMLWGNMSGLNETSFSDMMREAVKLLSAFQIFGDEPTVYQALEEILASNRSLILQKGNELSAWLTFIETNITPDNIVSMMWGDLYGLNETSVTGKMREAVKIMINLQVFGNEPMVYKVLEQVVESNDTSFIVQKVAEITAWLGSNKANITSENLFSMMWQNLPNANETFFTEMMREAVKLLSDLQILGNSPMVYEGLEKFLGYSKTSSIVQKVSEMSVWLASSEQLGLDFLAQGLPKIYDILRPLISTQMDMDMLVEMDLFEELVVNIIAILGEMTSPGSPLPPIVQQLGLIQNGMAESNYTVFRQRSNLPLMLMSDPMNDFIDLFYLNYPAMFQAMSVPPSTEEIMETVHMFFANPDLSVVLKGVSSNMPWSLNSSQDETITAALGVLSSLTQPDVFQMPPLDVLTNAADMLPDGFPFSSLLKDFTKALANESQEILILLQQSIQIATELPQMNFTDPEFIDQLSQLRSQVCALESMESVRLLMQSLSLEPGQLCYTFLPSLQVLVEGVLINVSSLTDAIVEAVFGDPSTYTVQPTWISALTQHLDLNITSILDSLNMSIPSSDVVTIGQLLRNETAFILDVQQRMNLESAFLNQLMETTLPNNNFEILSWLIDLRHCNPETENMTESDVVIFETFCSLSVEQWYTFSLLMVQHLNMEEVIYNMLLSEELQTTVEFLLQMAKVITDTMNRMLPAINQLQNYLLKIQDLSMVTNPELEQMTRRRRSVSSQSTFSTLSKAMCSNGIEALFQISKLPMSSGSDPSSSNTHQREEMINRFKIPQNATPFCKNMYLDMVSTTGGAIAWAFLKPLLMGKILFTPDTPVTRAIMEKANATLQEFANLRKNSEDWIHTSNYIIKSAEILSYTLPMLQNSLGNSFVKNFIEIQTDINVDGMKETLSSFSNMTAMLEQNRHLMDQITTLSNLMVELSSCVAFDRYRGYDSIDELNTVAQELAKNRDLFASVIFKFSQDQGSSTNRPARSLSTSSATSLPPKVSYTIRMHMDNVRRTDRIRDPIFVKDNHISIKQSIRYDRGFIYIQETIDRAIIEAQAGQKVTEPAVQLQPFSYPCHLRDEFLQGISFVFPLMLMVAWLLFVAEFVKKLVHERELRLHEYMKMMGVNPLSHFFAWFLECAAYLVLTIFMLTLVLKYGKILPNSDGFILFLYLCDYGLSVIAFSFLVSSFFDKTYIAGLSGSLLYIFFFFPFIMVMALETSLTFSQKSALSMFAPACFSYASQYVSRYETQGEGIHWSNSYTSPIAGDTASFGWLCWMMLIDSILYFIIGAYIRMVFPGKYGIPAPWYFPFKASFWTDLCCCVRSSKSTVGKGLLFTNIMQKNQPVFSDDKGKGPNTLSSQANEDFTDLPVGVALHGLSKVYGNRVGIENLNISFYEGHVTSLLGHNGAGKTTTMSLLTGLYPPSSGTVQVYGRDMETNIGDICKELGVCMQYDVLFDHMTTKEHLLLYGQIKAPHWTPGELREQVRTILEETGMHAHRHKLVGTLSGGMKRKLSISIAFIGGSRLVILDEPTTGVDPCSRRSIWDMVIQHKKHRTVIMSTHHLDEAEVLSDRIAFLERGGLKCCGSPFYLKDKLGQGYKLTLTKKMKNLESEQIDNAELKAFIQAHLPEARLKEAQGGDMVYSLPPFTSSNSSSYRSLLTALDSNLDALQLGGYGITDTTLEEVFLQLTHGNSEAEDSPLSISETLSDTSSIDSLPSDLSDCISSYGDRMKLTSSSTLRGMALAWQQAVAILIKRFHHSRRDWKGLIAQILLPVFFVVFAMGLGSLKNDLRNDPELELSPALYNVNPSYSFFRNLNPNSSQLMNAMTSFPGIDNTCLYKSDNPVCKISGNNWTSSGNSSKPFSICKCTHQEQICDTNNYQPPQKQIPSSQIVYNLTGIKMEDYLIATANDFIRNRYGGFDFGLPLPSDLQMDLQAVPLNRTLSKVWFNPEGHHTMPAYLNSLNNFILRSNLPADKDPSQYAISVSSQPYFARADDEDVVIQGMLQIIVAMCVLTGYSITTASFAIYEVNEHHSGSKRLQHISGISEPLYWTVNFLYDMAIYMIPVALTVAVIAAFQIPAYTDQQNLAAVFVLLVLFGFATFPWMYLLAGVFKDAEMAFITYVCINLCISVNTITATSIPYFLSQISINHPEVFKDIFEKLSKAFLIFPQFNFGNGLMLLARINIEVQILSGYGVDAYKNPFSTDALGWMFISSFIQGLVFITLRLLLNKFLLRKIRRLICGRKTVSPVPCEDENEDEDEDVAAEHLRVTSGQASSNILQVNQLTKVYQHFKKKVYAVKRISVGIPAGECFGLLGENGAGKTTTFKMLTGDISPTDGTAQIKDPDGRLEDIMECRNRGINIGYCPQVDALDNLLTGEEHLYFYARVRGVTKREIDGVVNYLLNRLQLNYHRKIITDSYSCGTRRKLSTALALIGNPQILLLDEPSSGMDPHTKRHLWKIISEEVKGKCAVVLTSHSMEECEALCSRLAIMVKGQFQCLGSLQHIKNRFGSGFTVKMYLTKASCDAGAITDFMQRRFPSTYLKDQHSNMVEYHVAIAPGGVADIFDQLESNKNALQIKHFSVSQTTLDEVFINFAMGNVGMETIPIHGEDECDNLGSVEAGET